MTEDEATMLMGQLLRRIMFSGGENLVSSEHTIDWRGKERRLAMSGEWSATEEEAEAVSFIAFELDDDDD